MRGLAHRHPARLVVVGFALLALAGMVLLSLPFAAQPGVDLSVADVVFTAVSAACVTGLTVVDTGTAWSGFGQGVILVLAQVGGIGIMTLLSALVITLGQRLGLAARALTRFETGHLAGGELRGVLKAVVLWSFAVEGVLAVILTVRFVAYYDMPWGTAAWSGAFHSVMAFNNAGFSLYPDSLTRFVQDWVVLVPVMVAIVIGGLGFPVLVEIVGRVRGSDKRSRWSLHSRLTLLTSAVLLVLGTGAFLLFEWTNDGTIGPLDLGGKLLAASFHSVTSRTAGFNTVDVSALRDDSLSFDSLLMFVGSGSASTGGGIKVSTLAVLVLVFLAEARGSRDITIWDRHLPDRVVRQALSITIISLGVVGGVTTGLLRWNDISLEQALYESVSAFGTVGLSTGITAGLDTLSTYLLAGLMFFGRVGPATLAAALALRQAHQLTSYPEERPLVG